MKRVLLFAAVLLALAAAPLNAFAATYIQDNGNMFSSNAKNQATQLINNMVQRTGRELVVYTVPSLNGQDARTAAENVFRQNRIEGVLVFASRDDRRLELVDSPSLGQVLPQSRLDAIRQSILDDFRANNQQGFDKGLIDGVNAINSSLPAASAPGGAPVRQSGPNWVLIGLLVIGALIIVWVVSGVMRARQQQPYFSYGQNQTPGYGQPGYGQPGYGPGWGGGGGGFFSGLMGGLGGALLGNALFDAFRPRDRFYDGGPGYDQGIQNQGLQGDDAGQIGDTSGGSWGDSGGGGGDWGGGGDGGGGDSGGSW